MIAALKIEQKDEMGVKELAYRISSFDYRDYYLNELIRIKKLKGLTVGVAIPCLNEGKTLGAILDLVIEGCGELADNVIVFDSGSTDNSEEICRSKGIKFIKDVDVAKELGLTKDEWRRGKGFNMWAAVAKLGTDLITYLDSDLINPHPQYVYGPLAPLIYDDDMQFVKGGFYLSDNDNKVTKILVEPLLSILFEEITDFYDPLSGMFAARTNLLRGMDYPTGYCVELHLLIESFFKVGPDRVCQIYLGEVTNADRSSTHRGKMSSAIHQYLLKAAEKYQKLTLSQNALNLQLIQHVPKEERYSKMCYQVGDFMLPSVNKITQ